MRNYGKVSPQFWIGETGKLLRGNQDAQILALYLMTNPHATMTGVFHCPVIYMAHETGLSMEGASKGLARLIEVGFCEYDEPSESVFVVNMATYRIDDCLKHDDKRVLGLRKEVAKMVPDRFQQRFYEVYGERFHLEKQGAKQSPSEAPSKPLPSQEQEQEQEQEQKQEQEQEQEQKRKKPATASRLPADWNPGDSEIEFCKTERPDLNPSGVADEFRDYWIAQPGAKGRKADWPATWRNWVRNQRGQPNVAKFLTPQQQRDENNRRSTEEFLNDDSPIVGGQVIEGKCANA